MQAVVFETLADPARRRIVEVLRGGEKAVNDIVEQMEIHQSGVSRHLRLLADAGFVQVRPEGARRLYSLRSEPFEELEVWLSTFKQTWNARLDRFGAELERRKKARKEKQS